MSRFGIPPFGKDPIAYIDARLAAVPTVRAERDPTVNDGNFPIMTQWLNTSTRKVCQLVGFVAGEAQWVCYSDAEGTVLQLATDAGAPPVEPDASGTITIAGGDGITTSGTGPGSTVTVSVDDTVGQEIDVDFNTAPGTDPVLFSSNQMSILGSTVARGTNTNTPVATHSRAANAFNVEVQVASARTGAPGNKNDVGLCSFDDTAFAVDADGYVTLAGGAGPAIDEVNVDANTAPGTDPVLPNASGQITVAGAAVAAHSVPVETHSRAANTYNIEVQVASDVTGAPGNTNAAGLSQFSDTQFLVDADGYVTLVGGTGAPTLGIVGDEGSGNVPDGSGDITITGDTVANATHAKPVYFDDTAASASTIDVQVATAIGSAPGDKNDAGLASFDSADFSVDTDGFVTLTGGAPDPETTTDWFDDFSYEGYIAASYSPWQQFGTAAVPVGVQQHYGVAQFPASGDSALLTGLTITTGGAEMTLTFYAKMGSATPSGGEKFHFGLTSANSGAEPTDGIYFLYESGQTNWRLKTANSSTRTDTDSSTAYTTDWVKLEFVVNSAGSSVEYFIDGSSVGTVSTNTPSTATQMYVIVGGANVTNNHQIDYFRFQQTRGT